MKAVAIENDLYREIMEALPKYPLFSEFGSLQLRQILGLSSVLRLEPGEALFSAGEPAEALFLLLRGEAALQLEPSSRAGSAQGTLEPLRLRSSEAVGAMELLLGCAYTTTVLAREELLVLKIPRRVFDSLLQHNPTCAVGLARTFAQRLDQLQTLLRPAGNAPLIREASPDAVSMLPREFMVRHRVMPLRVDNNELTLGFVDEVVPAVMARAREFLPGMEIRPARVPEQHFVDMLARAASATEPPDAAPAPGPIASARPAPQRRTSARLDALLRQVVAEGASDLHLAAGQKPRWRIDGDIRIIPNTSPLKETEVREMIEPALEERHRQEFQEQWDVDFAYAVPGLARFRVNLFRDSAGIGAALRLIPHRILNFEQLGLPPTTRQLCTPPHGLVLVTGATGSGKSTTLAAMIDFINQTRPAHIVTLEDPIEFVHESRQALINQREVGGHARSFSRALRAALREDPDIVLVGEMRDSETVALTLEIANTGHLVFATLHTNTAASSIERILGMFQPEHQQAARATLSDVLRGVLTQTLCRRIGGGRVVAAELLLVNPAVSNLIRESKTYQIPNVMATTKSQGNTQMNDELSRLVREHRVTLEEACCRTGERMDLLRRFGREALAS